MLILMKKTTFVCLLAALFIAPAAQAASNLLVNGRFEHPDNPLFAWQYKYERAGDSWYAANHERVKVEPRIEGRSGVLALWGDRNILFDTGQGTKVDSFPVEVKPGGRWRLTATARSTGPGARILVEGYQWRPGVKPHPNPDRSKLRTCYKSGLLFFGSQKGGSISHPSKNWQTANVVFPDAKPSDFAKSQLAKMEFLVVHIVAIDGTEGSLYVDDVKLEAVK